MTLTKHDEAMLRMGQWFLRIWVSRMMTRSNYSFRRVEGHWRGNH
jgi:hypothetical protein